MIFKALLRSVLLVAVATFLFACSSGGDGNTTNVVGNTDNEFTVQTVLIENGAMQKIPFELSVADSSLATDLEWYLDGNPITLPLNIFKEGMYKLTGRNSATNEILSTQVAAIDPQLVTSFEVDPGLNKSEYIYQNKDSSLGGVSLFVPKGSLAENTIIEVKESEVLNIPNTDGVTISRLLTLEPSGLQFDKPVVISLPYEGDVDPRNIVVVSYSDGGVVDINLPLSVDEENKEVTFSTTHFTEFALQEVAFTFVDKRKSEQTEILAIENLLGVTYTKEEWEQILNEPVEKTNLAVYDLFLEYQKLDSMYSLIPSNYAQAVRVVFPESSSALQEQIKTIESVSSAMGYIGQLSGLGFSPQGFTSAADKAEFMLSTIASLTGIPTSVSDLVSVDLYSPDLVINTLNNQFNKIDNLFYEELWSEFNTLFSSGADEDDFMRGVFVPENDLLRSLMEDSVQEGIKLKALLTPGMIRNLKLVYLRHKHFKQDKDVLLNNLKKIVATVYNADTKKLEVSLKNHNKYYINNEFIPSFLFQASGYGSEGLKGFNPKLVLSYEGQTYTFNEDNFTPYSFGVSGMVFDEAADVSTSQFVLSKKVPTGSQARNIQMSYKYTDDTGMVKEGSYYTKFISPSEVSLNDFKYDLRNYAQKYNKSINFTPVFLNQEHQYVDYNTKVTLGGRTDEGSLFVLNDEYFHALNNQSSASQSDLDALSNLVVTFSANEGSKYTFESGAFSLNLVELWSSLEEEEKEFDWSDVNLRYSGFTSSAAVSTFDSISLIFFDREGLNIEPLRLDLDGNGTFDQELSKDSRSISFKFPDSGIKGPSCVEFQHTTGKEIKQICTPIRLTLENGRVQENARPIAKNQEITLSVAQKYEIDLYGHDSDGDSLIYRISTDPKDGSIVSIDGDKVVYEPNFLSFYDDDGFVDGFNYVVNDGVLDSLPKYVKINKDESVVIPDPTENEVVLNLSGNTTLQEGGSIEISTGLEGDATRVDCTTSTSTGAFDLASYGGSLSNDKTNVYLTAPRYSEKSQFKLTCKASDANNILATDSIDIVVTEKPVEPPQVVNQLPTVSLPTNGSIALEEGKSRTYSVVPTVTDDVLDTVTYQWDVEWLGAKANSASTGSSASKTLTLNVPSLEPGESGSVIVKLRVTDADGEYVDDSVTYTYQIDKVEELGETTWDFTDGDTLERASKPTLSWTVKNVGNVDLTGVNLSLSTQKADKLNVGDISPAYIALWKEGETKTFEVTVEVPNDVVAGTHKQEWYFSHNGTEKTLLPYRNSTKAAYLNFEFLTADPSDLLARLLISSKVVEPNDTVYGTAEVHSGNQPYTFKVDWGDGSNMIEYPGVTEDFVRDETTYARQALEHSYSSEGEYNVTVTITDAAGKSLVPPLRDTIKVSTSKITAWSADVRDIDTSEHEENIPFVSEPYTSSGVAVGRYYSSWSPSVEAESQEYFVKYRLPVPKNVLSLSKMVRIAASVKASGIAAHDREFAFRTQSGKEYTAAIVDIDHTEGGYLRERNMLTGLVEVTRYPILVDDVKNTKSASYSLIVEPSKTKMGIWRDKTATTDKQELASLSNNFESEYISEIDITFKGNGVIDALILQYDINDDGEFSSSESLLLSTVNKTVDWTSLSEDLSETLIWTPEMSNNKTYYSPKMCDGTLLVNQVTLNADGSGTYESGSGSYVSFTHYIGTDGYLYTTDAGDNNKNYHILRDANEDYLLIEDITIPEGISDGQTKLYFSLAAASTALGSEDSSDCNDNDFENLNSDLAVNSIVFITEQGSEVTLTDISVKLIDIHSDANGYVFIPYVKARDADNKLLFEMKYCARDGGAYQCDGSTDWLVSITNTATNEIVGGAGGSFNTSDDPLNGFINGSFDKGSFSGRFKINGMSIINHDTPIAGDTFEAIISEKGALYRHVEDKGVDGVYTFEFDSGTWTIKDFSGAVDDSGGYTIDGNVASMTGDYGSFTVTLIESTEDYIVISSSNSDGEDTTRLYFDEAAALNGPVDAGNAAFLIGDGISNAAVRFEDAVGNAVVVPSDAFIRIIPNTFTNQDKYQYQINCEFQADGSFESGCFADIRHQDVLRSAISDSSETYQVLVFKNHINPGETNWECGENLYKYVGSSVSDWSNIVVKPTDFQDRSSDQCSAD